MIEDRQPAPPPSTGPPLPEHAVLTALRDGVAALDRVAASPLWSMTDDQALAAMDKAYALMAQAQGLASRLLCEVDQRQLATRAGAPSTKAWLRRRHQLTPGRARRDVELARALDGPLQATAAALSAGALSSEQAAAIADVLSHAPRSAGSTEKGQAEALLIESSGRHDPHELRRLGIHIWAVLDPDGVDADEGRRLEAQEARAFARRRFSMPPTVTAASSSPVTSMPKAAPLCARLSTRWLLRCPRRPKGLTAARRHSATPTHSWSCAVERCSPASFPTAVVSRPSWSLP
jgi:hypothetical protein